MYTYDYFMYVNYDKYINSFICLYFNANYWYFFIQNGYEKFIYIISIFILNTIIYLYFIILLSMFFSKF